MPFWPFGRQEVPGMHTLYPHIQRAVKRALDNIWFGQPDPIGEAVESAYRGEGIQLKRWEVEEPLAEYVNLIVRQLRPVPRAIEPMLDARVQELKGYIAEAHPRLRQVEEESHGLSEAIQQKQWDLQALRQHLRKLEGQERSLQRRLQELARAEREIQEQLAAIVGWKPVTLERAQALAEGLAEAAQEDLPEKS